MEKKKKRAKQNNKNTKTSNNDVYGVLYNTFASNYFFKDSLDKKNKVF